MSSFGVVSTGFAKKLIGDVLNDIETEQRADISPALNLLATSLFGQMNGIYGDKVRELWDVAESVYNAWDPDVATGNALDNIAAITGALRLAATPSTVTLTVNIDNGVTLAVGRLVSSPLTGVQFITTEAVTNSSGITDDFTVAAQSVDTGPISGPAGTLTTIDTPQAGWNTVTNTLDAVPGTNLEEDDDFRARREELLRSSGAATVEAIRAGVRGLAGVTQAFVFDNKTDVVDANGLPPHSFEVVVSGGTETTGDLANPGIAEMVFLKGPAGIQPFGNITHSVIDSQGFSQDMSFSRPVELLISTNTVVSVNANDYPIDGDAQVSQALVDLGGELLIGEDVVYIRFQCAPLDVAGVLDVTTFEMDAIPDTATSGSLETYNLVGGETLTVLVENETIQTVNILVGDITVGAATAAQVALRISTDLVGATAADVGGAVVITSDNGGSVLVTGGTANAELNFPTSITPSGTVNIPVGPRELARFDNSRNTVTNVP